MKRLLLVIPAALALAACEPVNSQNKDEAAFGAVVGGIVGSQAGNDRNRERNIILGAATGAAIGTAVGNRNQCRYRNTNTGEVFTAPCGSY